MINQVAAAAALLPLVAAHGFINDPPARRPGDAYQAACGMQPFYQQSSDINGNVQGIMQVVGDDMDASNCNLWLCKGFQFDDNVDNVQTYSPGQTIDMDINIAAPHTGFANVSIVDTATDSIIGQPLIEFDNYAANSGVAANNSAFSITMPESLDGCSEPGACVIQWFWDAPDIDQTYEACIDFVAGAGSGSGSGSGSTPEPQPEAPSSAPATPEPTAAAPEPVEEDEEEEDDCEEIPEDELPEEDEEEEIVEEDEDDCEEIPDDEVVEGVAEDDYEEEDYPTSTANGAVAVSTVYVTVTADPVTVTAEPTACA